MFQIHIEYSSTTIWVKNSVEIALSLTVSEILTFLGFLQKSKMAAKSGEKIEIFQFCIGYFAITLRVKNSVKIENFNYLNVAFISYKLTMWDLILNAVLGLPHPGPTS